MIHLMDPGGMEGEGGGGGEGGGASGLNSIRIGK